MPVHPQVAAFLQCIADLNAPPIYTLTPEQARRAVPQLPLPYEPVATVANRRIAGPNGEIPVRIYTPISAVQPAGRGPVPLLVFYHGGGWIVGDLDSYEHLSRTLANAIDGIVVSVDYRLAPEHKFPAGVEDCYTATAWAFEHAQVLGADPLRIIVSGDSAGGNLAAAVSLMARDRQGPPIAYQLLIYPVLDCRFETESYQQNATGYLLTQAAMRWYWGAYLPDSGEANNPYAAPLQATDLTHLPATHIITAEYDPLRDEGEVYAARLKAAGVPLTSKRYNGMIHGFVRRTDLYDVARQAILEMAVETKRALSAMENEVVEMT